MSEPQVLVGIAVSTAPLDVARRPTEDPWHVSHAAVGIPGLVERLPAVPPLRLVLAATGGLEGPAAGALAAAGLPVVVVKPRPARDVANATGRLATTDPLAAQGLAHVAAAVRPTPRPRPAAQAPAWRALLPRRRPLVPRLTAERRRRQTAPPPIRADLQAPIAWLERRLARTAADLAAGLRSRPRWRAQDEMLPRPPGGGPVRSRPLVAALPAWGLWHRQESAARRGGAPVNRDRGPVRGTRAVWGGRAPVRAVLDRRPVAAGRHHAARKAFDERRRAVGKAPKVALTACMRKLLTMLNAMLKPQTPGRENSAPHA
jgi:transposase